MTTLRRFMDDDEMDVAAINTRKYLLNRLIEYEDDYKETLSDNESDEISHTAGSKKKKIPGKSVLGTGPYCKQFVTER